MTADIRHRLLVRTPNVNQGSIATAERQLGRMRGMNRYYHERFFGDVRFLVLVIIGLLVVGFWEVPASFLLVPVIALFGAAQLAFDASYLIFSRQYAARLEAVLNAAQGETVLVGARLEDRYLFPLDTFKVVTAAPGSGFSWFGFMTLFYTALGLVAGVFGVALGWDTLSSAGAGWTTTYLIILSGFLVATFAVGAWWFLGGEGERRLRAVLDAALPVSEPART